MRIAVTTTNSTRRWAALAVATLVAVGLGACSSEEPQTAPTPTTSTPSPTTPSPTPEPTPEPEPTSTPFEGGPVLAVKIDHVDAAHPRVGIGSADIVYVDQVEFGLTRLMAIFASSLPSTVGPIRSARPNDPTILANFGAVPLVFSGASRQTYRYLEDGNQIDVEDGRGFARDNSRRAPHNLMGTPETLLERGDGNEAADIGFRFGDAAAGGSAATSVSTRYPAVRMSASYDSDSGGYEITTNGRTEIDALTGDPVRPTTIVVQKVEMRDSNNVTTGGVATPLAALVGSGEVIVLRDGQAWEGTWSRSDDEAPTEFRIGDDELTFAPGPVWVWFVDPDQSVTVQ